MSLCVSSSCIPHKSATMTFSQNSQGGLAVTIETERLRLRSVEATEEEYQRHLGLFGDAVVMEKFADGKPKTKEWVQTRIKDVWAQRWQDHDPYSGMAVFEKKEGGNFLGHVVLGHGGKPGVAEMAYLFHQAAWNQRYGTEAVAAVVLDYAPETVRREYVLEKEPLREIVATAREDNPHSWHILERVGMQRQEDVEKHGAQRRLYSIGLTSQYR